MRSPNLIVKAIASTLEAIAFCPELSKKFPKCSLLQSLIFTEPRINVSAYIRGVVCDTIA